MTEIKIIDLEKVRDTFSESRITRGISEWIGMTVLCGDCYYCQSQKTAYWSPTTNEAFCLICKGSTNLHSTGMQQAWREFRQVQEQIEQDPDGWDFEYTKERIANNYTEYQEIKRLIYSEQYKDLIPLIRQNKIYKVRSKSLSDEDRLFIVIHIYRDRNNHRIGDMSAEEKFNDFKNWLIVEKEATERNLVSNHKLSRAERRRLERKGH